jgi:hypothetical protein
MKTAQYTTKLLKKHKKTELIFIETVTSIEVKRDHLLANQVERAILKEDEPKSIIKRVYEELKEEIFCLDESELNEKIKNEVRIERYDHLRWHKETVYLKDLGVWPNMSGLDIEFCTGSVIDTAKKIEFTRLHGYKKRISKKGLDKLLSIQENIKTIQPKFPLIVIPSGEIREKDYEKYTRKKGEPKCKTFLHDIEDGSNRAVAYALAGQNTTPAYVGR